MYRNLSIATAMLCSAFLVSGCAGFKANKLPEVASSELKTSSKNKTKIFSSWNVVSENEWAIEANKDWYAEEHKEVFEQALIKSNCCDIVETAVDADVAIEGTAYFQDPGLTIIPAFLTGMSLHVIPSWYTMNVHISAEVKSRDKKASYDIEDSYKSVRWLPFVFVMPFTGSDSSVKDEVHINTHNNLILKMTNDGLIN